MTTSVSLWTVSAIGIAVGAGLYICSVVTVILIMLINHVLVYISHYQEEMNKEIAFYVEIKEGDAVKELVAYLKDGGYKLSSIMDTNSYRGDEKGLLDERTQDLIERREKYMSGSYRLFYRKSVNLVRGAGLFLGFELVSDIEKKTPDQKKALDLIELLRDNQVLTSCCGPFGNVLKIRPTLAFASHDIDWVASALDKCLTQLENA